MRLGFEVSNEKNTHHQPLTESLAGLVDSLPSGMEEAGDKMVTKAGSQPAIRSNTRRFKRLKKRGRFLVVKAGSAMVPIYKTETGGRVRFTLSFYRNGRRVRKVFTDLDKARNEALFVAQRVEAI